MKLTTSEIAELPKLYRNHLINSISGFKSANLIGTVDKNGLANLAVFSSVVHLGSDPPLLGFITRPHTVPRHTYENIRETGFYTINHVHQGIIQAAHKTSAKYEKGQDEFEISGLHKTISTIHPVPYVQESSVKIGLRFEEEHHVRANGTLLVVGRVLELIVDDQLLREDGYLDLSKANTVTINGLDGYLTPGAPTRLSYARPDQAIEEIKLNPE